MTMPRHPDDDNIPSLSEQAKAAKEASQANEARVKEARKGKKAAVLPEEPAVTPVGKRGFIAPAYKNGKFMVKPGVSGRMQLADGRSIEDRPGDKFAVFKGGMLITDDEDIIAWCEKHPEICRDAQDPDTRVWATLTESKLTLSTRSAQLPEGLDIDKLIKGEAQEMAQGTGDKLVQSVLDSIGA